MKNFIFKSSELSPDLQKILQLLLAEQRAQRIDLANLLRIIKTFTIDKDIQKQVDDYFGAEDIEETSPQTDIEDKSDQD